MAVMMQRIAFATLLMVASQITLAATDCGAVESLAGVFETEVRVGFTPNRLQLRRADDSNDYSVELRSYWAPKPNDDGQFGTMGDFAGKLDIPMPWSCVASLTMRVDGGHTDEEPPKCVLEFRFLDSSRIEVDGEGECDYFHGYRAVPYGLYLRVKA
jgi:hypothetical protein